MATRTVSRLAQPQPADGLHLARDGGVEVLVVGYGPVGAVLANMLARYGVRTLVIDRFAGIFAQPRAISLDNDALRILQNIGLSEADFETMAIPYVRLQSPLCGLFGRMNTLGPLNGHPKLVTFHQPGLERALRDRLADAETVAVADGVELVSLEQHATGVVARVRSTAGEEVVCARYVVAADGANSIVRKAMGLDFEGRSFEQDWLIVDATGSAAPIDHVEFLCDPRRPTPHMMAPGGRERWEFMLRPGESATDALDDANVAKLLAPWSALQDLTIERKAVYRFAARTAARFSKDRVFLVGDAAHITPPFAGQGLVAGLRDVANLAWKLSWVIQGKASPSILESYDEERRPHAKAMIAFALFTGRLVMPTNRAAALLIHGAMRLGRMLPSVRRYFDESGIKPINRFRRGLFARGVAANRRLAGDLLPQSWLRDDAGTVRLSDDVLGVGFRLIGGGVDPQAFLSANSANALAKIGGRSFQIRFRGQRLPSVPTTERWEDIEGALIPGSIPLGWVVLVRPDRMIVQAGLAEHVDDMIREAVVLLGCSTTEPTVQLRNPSRAAIA
ncbi:bifunctional 3-(3-hydroxy-phenyl)propionate/3-hydroxycinnamic acid hydroxylase [Sphingomonas sp. GB1N7]|uniref:bifunctional 3-(3-hydroxy-phenyl)propionate/3-hydroxycinnamic acid hydroxylase n=1 Tax=Parasphingomonas caseinilytica TaxID=3096158 RepID=UPI002FC6E453